MNFLIALNFSLMFFGYLMVGYKDFKTKLIPNRDLVLISIFTILQLIFRNIREGNTVSSIRALLAGFLIFTALLVLNLLQSGKLGMGDVKFGAVLGLGIGQWGISAAFAATAISFFLASIFALVMLINGKSKNYEIPFGPFLVVGNFVMYIYILNSGQFF